jgi:hypothetical protein
VVEAERLIRSANDNELTSEYRIFVEKLIGAEKSEDLFFRSQKLTIDPYFCTEFPYWP